jgi:hypothetical protein
MRPDMKGICENDKYWEERKRDSKVVTKYIAGSDKWVPATTTWSVLRLRMEERPPDTEAAANILNKQSRTAYKGWSSCLGVGRGANITSS